MTISVLGCHVLGKRHPTQVVLVHGLFASAGFWVPFLRNFENVQLTLLGIDYASLLESGAPLHELAARTDKLIGDKPAHLVGHSFGCWVGMYMRVPLLSRSFICPTFAAHEFHAAPFCAAISERLTLGPTAVAAQVAAAHSYKLRHLAALRLRADDHCYLPTADPYCRYVKRLSIGVSVRYNGDHFNVARAVTHVAARLALAPTTAPPSADEWQWPAPKLLTRNENLL